MIPPRVNQQPLPIGPGLRNIRFGIGFWIWLALVSVVLLWTTSSPPEVTQVRVVVMTLLGLAALLMPIALIMSERTASHLAAAAKLGNFRWDLIEPLRRQRNRCLVLAIVYACVFAITVIYNAQSPNEWNYPLTLLYGNSAVAGIFGVGGCNTMLKAFLHPPAYRQRW